MLKFVFDDGFVDNRTVGISDESGTTFAIPGVESITIDPPVERAVAVGNMGDLAYEEIRPGTKTIRFAGGQITLEEPRRRGKYTYRS
jgi:hypothetical protein